MKRKKATDASSKASAVNITSAPTTNRIDIKSAVLAKIVKSVNTGDLAGVDAHIKEPGQDHHARGSHIRTNTPSVDDTFIDPARFELIRDRMKMLIDDLFKEIQAQAVKNR